MPKSPLLCMEDSLEIYKKNRSKSKLSFGMDIFDKNFKIEDLVLIENDEKINFKPYARCEHYILILSFKGESIRYVNQYSYYIKSYSLQLLVPGVIHSFENLTKQQNSYVIFFDKKYFDEDVKDLLIYHSSNLSPIEMIGCEYENVKYLFEQINYEYNNKRTEYKRITKIILTQLLLILKRGKKNSSNKTTLSRSEQIMNQYQNLVEEHYQSKKTVIEYANILNLTVKYLSETVKEVSNRSALFHIHNRIMKEIEYLLSYSDLSVKQIAHTLNFSNSSELGRFFKRLKGISPSKYRLSIKKP